MIRCVGTILLCVVLADSLFAQNKSKSKVDPDDVLRNLPLAITLPELTVDGQPNPKALQPIALGKVDLPVTSTVLIALHGGENATRTRGASFALETMGDELTARNWDLYLRASKGERKKVAAISLKDSALQLQWTAEAVTQADAPSLCNCVLQVLAGKTEKLIALRKSVSGEPLKLSLSEPTVARYDLSRAPDAGRLKVELGLRGLGRFKLNGNSTLKAEGDESTLEFTEKGLNGMIRIRLECDTRRQFELKATPLLALPGEKPAKLSDAVLKKSEAKLQASVTQLDQQSQALALGGKAAASVRAQVDRQLGDAKKSLSAIQSARKFVEEFPDSATASVRVFFEVDKKLVDVLKTGR
jgi:hypothetical protein